MKTMKIKEIIAVLARCNPEAELCLYDDNWKFTFRTIKAFKEIPLEETHELSAYGFNGPTLGAVLGYP